VLAPGFYARQDIRTPVKVAIASLVATQLMNLALVWHLKHTGLALAISFGAYVNAGLLYVLLRRAGVYSPQPGWAVFMLKLGLAVYVMGAVLWLTTGTASDWLAATALHRAVHLTSVVAVGAAAYFAALLALGFRLKDFNRKAAE
jgi:putative peptidoglycan lipid II flippase